MCIKILIFVKPTCVHFKFYFILNIFCNFNENLTSYLFKFGINHHVVHPFIHIIRVCTYMYVCKCREKKMKKDSNVYFKHEYSQFS